MFDVTLSLEPPPPGASVQVDYTTVASTATAGTDYTPVSGTLTFTSDTPTLQQITVNVIGDTAYEPNETFMVVLSNLRGDAAFNDPIGLGTIFNDDTGAASPTPTPAATPTPSRPEGDVVDANGGPAGDGLVLANDVTAIRNFVLGRTSPADGSQFQRADVNLVNDIPCGNGQLDAGDVTVIRQMTLGTIPDNSPPCGPTSATPVSSVATEDDNLAAVARTIRAISTTGSPGQSTTVQLQLDAQSDEASLSYTVNFDPTVLTFVNAAPGNGVPTGTNLSLNSSQAAQGRLGVLLDSTNTYAQGTRQILAVTFNVAGGAVAGVYPISFSSVPTVQTTSNAQGALLPTAYEQGNVVIGPSAAGVSVSGRVTNANGQGIRGAKVVLTGADGNKMTATTGSFGSYTFADVRSGQTYVVGVISKRFRFTARIVDLTDSLADLDFAAME